MELNEQLKALHDLRDRLRAVLPERFELHVHAHNSGDQTVIVWDAREEMQYEYKEDALVSTVITNLLTAERAVGDIVGRSAIQCDYRRLVGIDPDLTDFGRRLSAVEQNVQRLMR